MGFFLNHQSCGGGRGEGHDVPYHKFVVIAPMIMKFGRGVKLDVCYTLVSKKFVTSLLLHNYVIITCILADDRSLNFRCLYLPNPFTDLAEIWYFEIS